MLVELARLTSFVILLPCLYLVLAIIKRLSYPLFSPLRDLPGPKSFNVLLGVLKDLKVKDIERYFETYGKVMKWPVFLYV